MSAVVIVVALILGGAMLAAGVVLSLSAGVAGAALTVPGGLLFGSAMYWTVKGGAS